MAKRNGGQEHTRWQDQYLRGFARWLDEDLAGHGTVRDLLASAEFRQVATLERSLAEAKGKPIAGYEPHADLDGEFVSQALMPLAVEYASRHLGALLRATGKCESPIEVAMLLALVPLWAMEEWDVLYNLRHRSSGVNVVWVEPQAEQGQYRVDFLIRARTYEPDFDNPDPRTGLPGDKTVQTDVIVECDGHDFHERTKAQARRDKTRDRALQMAGFPVLHFTGSEIWRDPFDCASQVFELVHSRLDDQW